VDNNMVDCPKASEFRGWLWWRKAVNREGFLAHYNDRRQGRRTWIRVEAALPIFKRPPMLVYLEYAPRGLGGASSPRSDVILGHAEHRSVNPRRPSRTLVPVVGVPARPPVTRSHLINLAVVSASNRPRATLP